ncbi:MAG: DUF6273 domain-containing protein [Eubacteriales bacterium]|nr:DUF6273 domain-containing protein [Eubacteriales bacterium]
MKKKVTMKQRLLSIILTTVMVLTGVQIPPQKVEAATLNNPRIVADSSMEAGQRVTWDCIWFGSYPQREVVANPEQSGVYGKSCSSTDDYIVDAALYSALSNATGWNSNGDLTFGNAKYRRMKKSDATYGISSSSGCYNWSDTTTYHYFKYQPIKWRVLKVSGSNAFLLADKALDDQQYNTSYVTVTWENSGIRSWLNGYGAGVNQPGTDYTSKNFLKCAFSASDQNAIQTTNVVNNDNISYSTNGGNNTSDKVFLLSEEEVYTDTAKGYGFVSSRATYDKARRSKSSTYAKAMGTYSDYSGSYLGNCDWWLRSPGDNTNRVASVDYRGYVERDGYGVYYINYGCRPALNLNLSSSNLWTYAGTVCSDGTMNEVGGTGGGSTEPVDPDPGDSDPHKDDYIITSISLPEKATCEMYDETGGLDADVIIELKDGKEMSEALASSVASSIKITSSDTSVAELSLKQGLEDLGGHVWLLATLKLKKAGTTTITATAGDITSKCVVTVNDVRIQNLKGSPADNIPRINLKWDAAPNVDGYFIQREKNIADFKETSLIQDVRVPSYQSGDLEFGETYYLRVSAYKTVNGQKKHYAWSEPISVKIPEKEKKAIIVIPGILGSELKTSEDIYIPTMDPQNPVKKIPSGKRVWMPQTWMDASESTEGLSLIVPSDDLYILGCKSDGSSKQKLEPVSSAPTENSIGTTGAYTALVHFLYNAYDKGNDAQFDVRFFAYDWRMSVNLASQKLESFISDQGYKDVILVCHSMGGLVASSYINRSTANKEKVDKLITIGTPYWGAPKALHVLETGEMMKDFNNSSFMSTFKNKMVTREFFKMASHNLPTVYELMPNTEYMNNYAVAKLYRGSSKKASLSNGFTTLNVDEIKDKIMKSHHNLDLYNSALNVTKQFTDNRALNSVDSYVIYSGTLLTIGAVIYDDFMKCKDIEITVGDGTVPLYSARAGFNTSANSKEYAVESGEHDHSSLAANPESIKIVKEIIDQPEFQISTYSVSETDTENNESEDIGALTKLYVEGALSYTISDASGNILLHKTETDEEVKKGYEDSFYFLDDTNQTMIAFLDKGVYKVEADKLIGEDFSCRSVEYTDYSQKKIDELKDYILHDARPETGVSIETNQNDYQVDKDGDGSFESTYTVKDIVEATAIHLDKITITMKVGETEKLMETVSPSTNTGMVEWFSNDETIASVSATGEIKAEKEGTTQICASIDGVIATCSVTVEKDSTETGDVNATAISLNRTSVTMKVGEKTNLISTVTPSTATGTVTWSSNDRTIATVSSTGEVKAEKEGTTQIYASIDGKFAICTIIVEKKPTPIVMPVPNTIIAQSFTKIYSTGAQSFNIGASCLGGAKLAYTSNNSNITVNSAGQITVKAKYMGQAVITITSSATAQYKAAMKQITVTVTPKKTTISKATSPKKKTLKVTWKKNATASGYQVYLSTSKTFASNTKAYTVKGQKKLSTTVKKLKSKKKYYAKVRAYKTVSGNKIYGPWSAVKACKVK